MAGANAIGKSNFFDALIFLSHLADNTILHSAKSIRSEDQKHSNIQDIFFRNGSKYLKEMSFEIDMIVPLKAEDDLGQVAEATITTLRYFLTLKLNDNGVNEPIEIVSEQLLPITQTETKKNLHFSYEKSWLNSLLHGRRSTKIPFISSEGEKIKLHQDGNKGRTTDFIAQKMPRTLLSTVTAESPTAFLARKEMRHWMMLQFEPSALRQPNFVYEIKNAEIKPNGSNLPATLYRLHLDKEKEDIYQKLTNKLKGLVEEVNEISVDKDEKRDLLTLQLGFKGGLTLPAQSLSDGTLRFLGLAVIELDSNSSGLICLEEPENGINPKKVNEMVELLKGMASDTDYPVDDDNPLRQVIINTHSPIVVSAVPDESLYLAKKKEMYMSEFEMKINRTAFSALQNTWKTENGLAEHTSIGEIISYLDKGYIHNPNPKKDKGNGKRTVGESIDQLRLNFQS
ncbi:AAA family ATPase [Flavobacterium kingsejongi]|uniref:ATPase AAA-type core domain-containing protein n=1 Tax=Flavobacterium kingsejongi TaxID=1678728 RepID=A0A2S1LR44_9FLAO|nr:ATP-binding protein [Flavobacterium kingsejongi]AWG26158.1 hypothetical protein FK004_13440 [Flavobacterium kingsejongi]